MEHWRFLASYDAILAYANIFIALGTIILAIGIPLSIMVATREERVTSYTVLDQTYFEIQKLLIEHPHLGQPDRGVKSRDQAAQYDAFAFLVWNFLETIFDYGNEQNQLFVTWGCILRYEARKHAAWFLDPENRPKFKGKFIEFVESNHLLTGAPAEGDFVIPRVRLREKIRRFLRRRRK